MKNKTLNHRLSLIFLVATFAVAIYAVAIEVLVALDVQPFAANNKGGGGIFTIILPLISGALYLHFRQTTLHPLSAFDRPVEELTTRQLWNRRRGVTNNKENKLLISRFSDEISPYTTGLFLYMALGTVGLAPFPMLVLMLVIPFLLLKLLRFASKLTYGNDI